uniref:Ras-related GTP-binding protein n=1 Tax=Amphilophus citrinellus TaxID=61819 RepID=A0A3Q0SA50_AMPCI
MHINTETPLPCSYLSPSSDPSVADDSVNGVVKPRILLMGLRRSGKSSIQKVVFHKMSPSETLFLESTNKICREDVSSSSFVSFQIWDFPGQIDFFDPTFDYEMIFRGTGALIFVIDSQDDYVEALSRLHLTVTRAYKVNPSISFEVFIHKVDGLSDDHKIEKQRDIHKRTNNDLTDAGLEQIHLSFYLTSIYDHSIFEAFSKVVQKLIPQLPTLENLLNIFISVSNIVLWHAIRLIVSLNKQHVSTNTKKNCAPFSSMRLRNMGFTAPNHNKAKQRNDLYCYRAILFKSGLSFTRCCGLPVGLILGLFS